MKTKAVILFFCLGALMFDTIAAYDHNKPRQANMRCCKKMMAKKGGNKSCPFKTKSCSNECFNCPLFYAATLCTEVAIDNNEYQRSAFFPLYKITALSDFYSKAWKPPNII